jgi:hypothetical protein
MDSSKVRSARCEAPVADVGCAFALAVESAGAPAAPAAAEPWPVFATVVAPAGTDFVPAPDAVALPASDGEPGAEAVFEAASRAEVGEGAGAGADDGGFEGVDAGLEAGCGDEEEELDAVDVLEGEGNWGCALCSGCLHPPSAAASSTASISLNFI